MAVSHLYVHLPFCRSRCAYCDFASEPVGPHLAAGRVWSYVEVLGRELEAQAALLGPELSTIYVGGGTPTVVPAPMLLSLLHRLGRLLAPGGEYTVEANPGMLDARLLDGLAGAGVTRISIGVQSFSPRLRAVLGRRMSQRELLSSLRCVKVSGWSEWNLDLIFGIPSQSWIECRSDLEQAMECGPTHISLYDLAYTPRYRRHLQAAQCRVGGHPSDEPAPGGDPSPLGEERYSDAVRRLTSAGFRRYEISNFAVPGHECRHNLAYWNGSDYVGIGASAVSTVGLARWSNPASVAAYLRRDAPSAEELTPAIRRYERAMLGLRTSIGIAEAECSDIMEPGPLLELRRRGYVHDCCGTLRLAPHALDISNSVLAALLRSPLDEAPSVSLK